MGPSPSPVQKPDPKLVSWSARDLISIPFTERELHSWLQQIVAVTLAFSNLIQFAEMSSRLSRLKFFMTLRHLHSKNTFNKLNFYLAN